MKSIQPLFILRLYHLFFEEEIEIPKQEEQVKNKGEKRQ